MRGPYLATAAILAGLVNVSVALAQNIPAELTQARADRRTGLLGGDRAAYDKLTTAGFVSVDQTGLVENKAERGARIAPPANPARGGIAPPQRLNERTTMYNNDMVVFFWQQNAPQGLSNFTETWVKEDGQWKCAASHFSVPPPAGAGAGAGGGGREGARGRGGN